MSSILEKVFVDELNTLFKGYYHKGEKSRLWPTEQASEGYDDSFEIMEVFYDGRDVTDFFDKLVAENLINVEKIEELILEAL